MSSPTHSVKVMVYRPRDPAKIAKQAAALIERRQAQGAGEHVHVTSHRALRRIIDESNARFVGYASAGSETIYDLGGKAVDRLAPGDILVRP